MEGFSGNYQQFLNETEELIQKFEFPVPYDPVFGPTCEILHSHFKGLLAVWLQNAWGEYCRTLLELSLSPGQTTLAGRELPTDDSGRLTLKQGVASINAREGLDYPVWHRCQYVIWLAEKLELPNLYEITTALSPLLTATRLTRVRNYVVHPSSGTHYRYLQVTYDLGNPEVEVGGLLTTRQTAGISLFELWVRELQGSAEAAGQ